MSLDSVNSHAGYLQGLRNGGIAISEPIIQQMVENDYRTIKECRMNQYLHSIATIQSSADVIKTARPFVHNEPILINTEDNTTTEVIVNIANTSQATGVSLVRPVSSNTSIYGTITASYNGTYAYRAFDDTTEVWSVPNTATESITFQFPRDQLHVVKQLYLSTSTLYSRTTHFTLSGSVNSLDFFDLFSGSCLGTDTFTLGDPGAYEFYRLTVSGGHGVLKIRLLGDGYQLNVGAVTNGEIPSRVFTPAKLSFNGVTAVEDTARRWTTYRNGSLEYIPTFPEVLLAPTRSITTQVEIGSFTDKVVEITGQIHKLELVEGNAIHTENSLPMNTVSVGGVDAPLAAEAYRLFDGDLVNNAFTATTDATGATDIHYIYEFDTPVVAYKLFMRTGLATEAPSLYKVFGSYDNIAYTELLDVDQEIAVDDLELTRPFDAPTYGPYKYYKIHITKGNTADAVVAVKECRLLVEE